MATCLKGSGTSGVIAGGRDLAEVIEDVAEVGELVDEMRVERVLRQDVAVGVDELLEGASASMRRLLRDGGDEIAPEVVDELLRLLAVGVAHLVEDEGLDGRLVLADAGDLDVDAVFVEGVLVVGLVAGEAGHFHFAVGIHGRCSMAAEAT